MTDRKPAELLAAGVRRRLDEAMVKLATSPTLEEVMEMNRGKEVKVNYKSPTKSAQRVYRLRHRPTGEWVKQGTDFVPEPENVWEFGFQLFESPEFGDSACCIMSEWHHSGGGRLRQWGNPHDCPEDYEWVPFDLVEVSE